MRTTDTHVYFWEGPFSNFHPCKVQWFPKGIVVPTSEHLYMYFKAYNFKDKETAEKILATPHPRDAKKLGRSVKDYDDDKWTLIRENYMFCACLSKFSQNEDLKQELLNTESRILVEASPYDRIWGVGLRETDDNILDESKWEGLNLLGETLMRVRTTLANFGNTIFFTGGFLGEKNINE